MLAQQLSRQDVEAAFREMGELLVRARTVAEIAVYGGAAIMLQFAVNFRTGDVDVRVETGDHGAVMDAAAEVARQHGWLRSWFSEAVTMYLGTDDGTELHGSYPSEIRVGLRVYVAKPDYLLAMKLRAMRIGTRDEADASMLAHASGITAVDAMLALLRRYFPKETPDPRRVVIIAQFAETLHATPPEDAC
jgi:hypothetical protein